MRRVTRGRSAEGHPGDEFGAEFGKNGPVFGRREIRHRFAHLDRDGIGLTAEERAGLEAGPNVTAGPPSPASGRPQWGGAPGAG
ncbi:hypothetical protein [Streptomyces sp. NBC_01462]|uniref:hypothetical protein n=1 Tax=Streptomyces sp. NBC_01462 TaxID=2903876 RepID=UPI002E35D9AC|nr:hypothetical protein [Streptomyces sp. NBC_01462]